MSFTADEIRAKAACCLERWERERAEQQELAAERCHQESAREYLDDYLALRIAEAVKKGANVFYLNPPAECKTHVIARLNSLGLKGTCTCAEWSSPPSVRVEGVDTWYAAVKVVAPGSKKVLPS